MFTNFVLGSFIGVCIFVLLFAFGDFITPDELSLDTLQESQRNTTSTLPIGWERTSNDIMTFDFPAEFPTTYITPVDWPPSIALNNDTFTCTEAGEPTARAGMTEVRTINGKDYCVTTIMEGAAGSVYTQYAYVTEREGETLILTFSTRSVQCGNYDEPQKSQCERERTTFTPDEFVDDIVSSIEMHTL